MGNDHSQLKGLEIDNKSIEVTDFWTLYSGELPADGSSDKKSVPISLFRGEPVVAGQLWATQGPLDRATKVHFSFKQHHTIVHIKFVYFFVTQNFMIYRHPSILKFISSWERGSQKFLVTERCRPLTLDLAAQSCVQICLGLRSILCSLIFLVEQGGARHLNVCASAVYVAAKDGAWRMAGFEHLWKSADITDELLKRSQPFRYGAAVDPSEARQRGVAVEQFAFAILCEEILRTQSDADMPNVDAFKKYCAEHLRHKTVGMRPQLSAVLLHPYFNHEFVVIHSFLTEMPLKCPAEKQQFFTGLIDRLRAFSEVNVATQMIDLLLSRIVLLDATAQLCVTPFVLKPRTDDLFPALFTVATFTAHVVPKILQIFTVRDAQIRLILLEYFGAYVRLFPVDILTDQLLPLLLLGIKDTNDVLVAATLRCLADLIPLLGASIVVGRNRGRLFADGRPQGCGSGDVVPPHWTEHRSITPVMNAEYSGGGPSVSPALDHVDISGSYESASPRRNHLLQERLSPDGGEDVKTTSEVMEMEDDTWSDWETEGGGGGGAESPVLPGDDDGGGGGDGGGSVLTTTVRAGVADSFIKDVKELDIKIIPTAAAAADIDFFKDMEPVICKTNVLLIGGGTDEDAKPIVQQTESQVEKVDSKINVDKSRFEMKTVVNADDDDDDGGDAWGNEGNDWGDEDG